MNLSSEPYALRGAFVFPVDQPPIPGGIVTIADGRVVDIGSSCEIEPIDLGQVAILPGLVNTHTHLEFSHLSQPIGSPGMSFPAWIREVVTARRNEQQAGTDKQQLAVDRRIAAGLDECRRSGTTSLGDIATTAWSTPADPELSLDATVFREVIALSQPAADERLAAAARWLESSSASRQTFRPALSPHAPYTVHPDLVLDLCRLSQRHRVPVAMHLAESVAELELLASASGPFVELLEELEAWDASAIPTGSRPLDYLHQLATADRALVVHGNYLDSDELDYLATHAARLSVVYCPRTHAYFGHRRYPLAEMLAQGLTVALGTDSRASNPSLSLWEELQFVSHHHPSVAPSELLRLGTINGARALGIDHATGSLAIGKRADLAIVGLRETGGHPFDWLFAGDHRIVETVIAGTRLPG